MSETNQGRSNLTLLTVLILLLLLFVGAQAWYMADIKNQLGLLQEQLSTTEEQIDINAAAYSLTEPSANAEPAPEIEEVGPEKAHVTTQLTTPVTDKVITDQDNTQTKQQTATPDNQSINPVQPDENKAADDSAFDPSRQPYAEIQRMQREMDRMFDERFRQFNNDPFFNPGYRPGNHPNNRSGNNQGNRSTNRPGHIPRRNLNYNSNHNQNGFQRHFSFSTSTPEIKVKEDEQQYLVFMNLPGAKESNISVTMDGQRLSIRGKQDYKKQDKDATGNVIFQEHRSGNFQRGITLYEPVNQDQMKTELENGVLKIVIPKIKNHR